MGVCSFILYKKGVKPIGAEKNFENKVKRWLVSQGIYPFGYPKDKMNATPCGYFEKRWGGGQFTKAGLPDLYIVVRGKAVEVELKAETGKPSELQTKNIEFVRETGGIAGILYPRDFDKFKERILDLKNENL